MGWQSAHIAHSAPSLLSSGQAVPPSSSATGNSYLSTCESGENRTLSYLFVDRVLSTTKPRCFSILCSDWSKFIDITRNMSLKFNILTQLFAAWVIFLQLQFKSVISKEFILYKTLPICYIRLIYILNNPKTNVSVDKADYVTLLLYCGFKGTYHKE